MNEDPSKDHPEQSDPAKPAIEGRVESAPADPQKPSALTLKTFVVELILLGGVATGLWIVGEHLENHGFGKSGTLVNLVAAITFFAIAPISATKVWGHPATIWGGFGIFCVILGALWGFSSSDSKPKPRITFTLNLSPNVDLDLTNDYLHLKTTQSNWVDEVKIQSIRGAMLIPFRPQASKQTMTFIIRNDSPTDVDAL